MTLDHFIYRIWITTLAIHWAAPAIIKNFNELRGAGGPQTASSGEAEITSDMWLRGAYIEGRPISLLHRCFVKINQNNTNKSTNATLKLIP